MKFKGTLRRMSPQQMSTMIRTNVAHLVNFEQTHEVSVTYGCNTCILRHAEQRRSAHIIV